MLLVTEYDEALKVKSSMPPSLVREVYLAEGMPPKLNNAPTMFGEPVHFVYLGYDLRTVEGFIASLPDKRDNIVLISPLSRWGLYNVKLKTVGGIRISNQFDTKESKIALVTRLTGLRRKDATHALTQLKFNLALLEKNLDLLRWCRVTGSDVETALASVEYYSYRDVLFYLAGSPKHTREKFIRTLAKYRYARKSMIKYLKDSLDTFINFHLYGSDIKKDAVYQVEQLSQFLYLEDALRLRTVLDKVRDLSELLKGEI